MQAESTGLTEQLRETRDTLVAERADLYRKMEDLRKAIERNAREIEATDTLLLRLDPRHIALDVRTDVDPKPLLTHVEAGEQPEVPLTPPEHGRDEERATQDDTDTSLAATDGNAEESPAIETPAGAAKPRTRSVELSANQIALNKYFKKSKRSKTLLSILKSKTEPVGTQTIISDYKALYPLWSDDREIRALLSSRISAALAYMVKRGDVIRLKQKVDGRQSEAALWQLSPNRPRRKQAGKKRAVAKQTGKRSTDDIGNEEGRATTH